MNSGWEWVDPKPSHKIRTTPCTSFTRGLLDCLCLWLTWARRHARRRAWLPHKAWRGGCLLAQQPATAATDSSHGLIVSTTHGISQQPRAPPLGPRVLTLVDVTFRAFPLFLPAPLLRARSALLRLLGIGYRGVATHHHHAAGACDRGIHIHALLGHTPRFAKPLPPCTALTRSTRSRGRSRRRVGFERAARSRAAQIR